MMASCIRSSLDLATGNDFLSVTMVRKIKRRCMCKEISRELQPREQIRRPQVLAKATGTLPIVEGVHPR